MKTFAQLVAFVIGTFIAVSLRNGDGSVSTGDLLWGALWGGGIASALVGALFKEEPPLKKDVPQPTISASIKPVQTDKPVDTEAQESLRQAQYERQQRISQLDIEISSLNQEVDKLNRQMPKLSSWSPIFSVLLIIGGLYTPILGSSENIGLFLLIGAISVITGFGLIIKRNRSYKKNKPVLDEIEKKKQHLLQLVRESQDLKNARY